MSLTSVRQTFVGGHIREEVKDALDEDADHLDISRSKLLDAILADYYGIADLPLEYISTERKKPCAK